MKNSKDCLSNGPDAISLNTQGQLCGAISDWEMMEIEVFILSKAPNSFSSPTFEGVKSKIFPYNYSFEES